MESKKTFSLKPETIGLLKWAALVMTALYGLSLLFYQGAGTLTDYQTAMIISEKLAEGLRAGFGLLCLGLIFMESK